MEGWLVRIHGVYEVNEKIEEAVHTYKTLGATASDVLEDVITTCRMDHPKFKQQKWEVEKKTFTAQELR